MNAGKLFYSLIMVFKNQRFNEAGAMNAGKRRGSEAARPSSAFRFNEAGAMNAGKQKEKPTFVPVPTPASMRPAQ